MFGSLDYIYVPAADVDDEALRYVQTLGAELVWKVRGMGTTVACLRVGEPGPAILLSGHLPGPGAILVYRVQDYAATVAQLRARGVAVHELEIPHGPCATFTMRRGSGTRSTSSCGPTRFTCSTAASIRKGDCAAVVLSGALAESWSAPDPSANYAFRKVALTGLTRRAPVSSRG